MISTHILDTSIGNPASGVKVTLELKQDSSWNIIKSGVTNEDGRFKFDNEYKAGEYRIVFEIEGYYQNQSIDSFFLNTPVSFKVIDTNRNYHVPLLLNPFGYSTYRGS